MTPTVYLSHVARAQIAIAEADLYFHLPVTPGGLCVTCAEPEPCSGRYAALQVLLRYGVLPKRRPGVAGVRTTGSQTMAGFVTDQTRSNEAR
ncbi:hypothetical protein EDD30_0877 [Couchioplanes caeruleus]|uniref:Uncharacterized protein n=1 Tax=Couchioplanes caeruleus TaxID=56438 RepID=A0A3N1GD70_9ACTN|nr:hypothetical protein EDD30_0877 [Couchioplanes caeruleus]